MANERKMCPLLAIAVMLLPVPGYDPLSVDGNEAPCRREKCAWWVEYGHVAPGKDADGLTSNLVPSVWVKNEGGHCAILDRGE